MPIIYRDDILPSASAVIELYDNAGLQRPTDDADRIAAMYGNSDLVVSAWDGDVLAGVARSLTDWCFCCYLSDLAVRKDHQHHGIGKELIRLTKLRIGERCMLLLLSVPAAVEYYPKVGMEPFKDAFIIRRKI
jgi:GNAT superfamily N-acetyltransferase